MNEHDHAVVIGVSRYSDADREPPWIGNLKGPDNDAADVAAWLRKPTGGGLCKGNVRLIRSADEKDRPPHGRAPEQGRIETALNELASLSSTACEGQYAGRRAYIYVAGHGIATQPDEAALVTAEAERDRPLNILITSWLTWLFTAGMFKELVLWVDCCATLAPLAFLKPCDRNTVYGAKKGSADRFVAYAARFDKQAVEGKMPDGRWHGVFTYTLLSGLEGAAATGGTGTVTGNGLRNYLHSTMSSFLAPEQRIPAVSSDPDFGATDELVFGSAAEKPKFQVTLRMPADCIGERATISVDATSPLSAEETLDQTDWVVSLEAGTYVVFVARKNVVHPFTVKGGGDEFVTVPK